MSMRVVRFSKDTGGHLVLRKGFSSSAPKEILEAPPGGRNTLQDMGQKNDYNYTQQKNEQHNA